MAIMSRSSPIGRTSLRQDQAAPAGDEAGSKTVPDIMGVTEAAEYIGVAVEDVVELCNSGELKAKKIGSKLFCFFFLRILEKAHQLRNCTPRFILSDCIVSVKHFSGTVSRYLHN